MNDNLSEQINLPKIGGTIYAFLEENHLKFNAIRDFHKATRELNSQNESILNHHKYVKSYNAEYLRTQKLHLQLKLNSLERAQEQSELKCKEAQNNLKEVFRNKDGKARLLIEKETENHKNYSVDELKILQQIYEGDLSEYYITKWKVDFIMQGPDARHLDGSATLRPNDVKELIIGFKDTLEKMQNLQKTEFSGSYSKKIKLYNPSLEIIAENKKIGLKFGVSSKNWQYYRELNINEVVEIIGKMEMVEEKATRLMETLKTLCF